MQIFVRYFILIPPLVLLFQCARVSYPSGGEIDSLPPVMTYASPKMNTIFFDKEEIIITFDEYIKLNDITKQLIISPPMDQDKYKIKPQSSVAKKIKIELLDSLISNTTYTFNFGESVIDNNEGNLLPFFQYTLSTGAVIDSLEIKGVVTDAFEIETEPYTSLHLYPIDSTYTDSTIFLNRPFYVTSTLDSVIYNFRNLKGGSYEIIAIKDVGSNYVFNQNVDKIGFLDHPITLPQDSVINFRLFHEEPNLFWGRPFFINKRHIGFGYYGTPEPSKIEVQSKVATNFSYLITRNRETDTLDFWFKGPALDSLKLGIKEIDTTKVFTIRFKKEIKDSLIIESMFSKIIQLRDTFKIKTNLPITNVNPDLINITNIDTLEVPFSVHLDDNYDRIALEFDLQPNDHYKIRLSPLALEDFWGNTHDTIFYQVKTKAISDYGNLNLQLIRNDSDPFVLELLNKNGEVQGRYSDANELDFYQFPLLAPGEYLFRYIRDENDNKKWDTGNYLNKIQPEEVLYSQNPLELRANWDVNETLRIPDKNTKIIKRTIVLDSVDTENSVLKLKQEEN